jgi:hypothetical protein
MIDKIEVYVKIGKVIRGQYTTEPISDQIHDGHAVFVEFGLSSDSKSMLKYELAMSDADREALRIVKEFADKERLRIEVHDVTRLRERLKAARFRIGRTPVVVFCKKRFEGKLKPEHLASVLEASVGSKRVRN